MPGLESPAARARALAAAFTAAAGRNARCDSGSSRAVLREDHGLCPRQGFPDNNG